MKVFTVLMVFVLLVVHASATVHYVDLNCTNPLPPYADWGTAATNIQSAINTAVAGDMILVTNGVYQTGVSFSSPGSNRVTVAKAVLVKSVNGPQFTSIKGFAGSGFGKTNRIRCVFLTNGASLSGFTLTSGSTSGNGGGVYCWSSNAVVSNCIVTSGFADGYGGGSYGGSFVNCYFTANWAHIFGGASYGGAFTNCVFWNNSVDSSGGATYNAVILVNCTVVGNHAGFTDFTGGGGTTPGYGGGVDAGTGTILKNCIVYDNYIINAVPDGSSNIMSGSFVYNCCIAPTNNSAGTNIARPPAFVNSAGGNFRLQTNSPCINAGNNGFIPGIGTDTDGRARLTGGTVDIGAFEFQSANLGEFTGWLYQYKLPTDGSADFIDSDSDGINNWQEWKAGTIPTNAASLLKMSSPSNSVSGVTVKWQSVAGVNYYLQRSTNLSAQPAFSSIQSNIVGQAGSTSYMDTTATSGGPYFYRVGVQ